MSKDKAVDYFDRHQSSNECHITSDGRVFHTLGSAQSFAAGLKNNEVTSYKRAEFETVISEDSQDDNLEVDKEARFKTREDRLIALGFERIDDLFGHLVTGSTIEVKDVLEISDEAFEISITPVVFQAPQDESPKVEALETLKNFDTATASYEDIKSLAKALALESPSNSKVDLIAAIEAQKAIINTEVKE